MNDEALQALRRVGMRPGDLVINVASSGLPMYRDRDRDRRVPWSEDQWPSWFPRGGLGLVLAVDLSHHPDCEARPALLLALSMEPAHVIDWTTDVHSFESLT